MEYYQIVQSRAYQTVAVLNNFTAGIKVGGITADGLQSQADALTPLAQTRDDAINTEGASANAENLGQMQLHDLVVQLPKVAEGELNDAVPAEAAFVDSLAPVFAIAPRTTALVLERGMRLKSALGPINTYLAAQVPVRGPITSGGKGLADLTALITAQPDLIQDKDDKQADVSSTRSALHAAASVVDRLNKRFYAKLEAEAATQPALAAALKEITKESDNRPATLSIKSILQGGTDNLHLLVNYVGNTFVGTNTNTLEWEVAGVDAKFTHSIPVDPSGNTLGAFTVGQTVKIRTRVTNANGTTTCSVRTLTIQHP